MDKALRLFFRLAHVVRHVSWDGERELDVAAEGAVCFKPRRLVDKFVNAFLLDSIGVDIMVFEKTTEDFGSTRWMTLEERFTDDVAV